MTQTLLLFTIGTTTWGVEDGDISSVTAARPLHRLPLSPPAVAGMALVEENAVTVFDLGACLGAPPLSEPQKGSFLLVVRDGRTTAFAVAGKVDRADRGDDRIVALPAPASSPVIESCLVREASLVPIINMQKLLERVKGGDLDVPSPPAPSSPEQSQAPAPSAVLLIALGGEKFCIDALNATYGEYGPGRITVLPYARRIAGVMPDGRDVVPVLPLAGRIGLEGRDTGRGMVITEIDGKRCGLPVDREMGRSENVAVLQLPPVARPLWSRGAIVENGEVIPLIDLPSLGAVAPARDENYLAEQYHPASAFPACFRKGSVEVIELSVFGTCHAVPKDEVAEVLPWLPVRRLTQTPEIVLGVAELKGRLLPVLDLEAIFGRRSPVGPDWKMVRITNGDFDALVAVETVYGGKELPEEMQRQVPIAIPHQVLYGCYLDSSAVRLILNVEALAVHFEKTEIREFISSMSPEMPAVLMEPRKETAATPPLPQLAAESAPAPEAPAAEEPAPAEMHGGGGASIRSRAGAAYDRHAARSGQETAAETRETAAQEGPANTEEEARKRFEAEARERAAAEERKNAEEAEYRQRLLDEERKRIEEEARQRREREESERVRAEEETRRRLAEEERRRSEEEAAGRRRAEEERQRREEEARTRQAEEERLRAADEARKRAEDEARQREEAAARSKAEEEEARLRRIEEEERRQRSEAEAKARENERLQEVVNEELRRRPGAAGTAKPSSGLETRSGKKWGLPVAAMLAAVALIALLFYLSGRTPGLKKDETRPVPSVPAAGAPKEEVAREARARKGPDAGKGPEARKVPEARKEPESRKPLEARKAPEAGKEPEAPLYLNVPAAQPAPDTVIYVVVKGDTLWGIAKRFTGSPFNYPRVAKDNSIATPDLIFPGQRIKLIQEKR